MKKCVWMVKQESCYWEHVTNEIVMVFSNEEQAKKWSDLQQDQADRVEELPYRYYSVTPLELDTLLENPILLDTTAEYYTDEERQQ